MNIDLIRTLILIFATMSAGLIYAAFLYSFFRKNSHVRLCELFSEKFGFLPQGILFYRNGGFIFTFQKDAYFYAILAFKKHSWPVRDVPSEHYDFIKELPPKLTRWIKFKFYLLFIGGGGFLLSALFIYLIDLR